MSDWNRDDPLARVKGETTKANSALRDYALMGAGRSLRKLHERYQSVSESSSEEPPTQRLPTILNWSTRWDWQARIAEWDAIQFEREKAKWEERRLELREQDWRDGQELRARVAAFVEQLPKFVQSQESVTQREGPDGQPETVRVITVALNATISQLSSAIKAASDLQRMAADEPTERVELTGAALDSFIERQLARLVNSTKADIGSRASDNGRTADVDATAGIR